jgi:hypothetical protein
MIIVMGYSSFSTHASKLPLVLLSIPVSAIASHELLSVHESSLSNDSLIDGMIRVMGYSSLSTHMYGRKLHQVLLSILVTQAPGRHLNPTLAMRALYQMIHLIAAL